MTKSSIVGLWDGGLQRQCGVYHGTGKCMMRSETWVRADAPKKAPHVTNLCHVCRYLVVDIVDPRRHRSIDGKFKPVSKKTP